MKRLHLSGKAVRDLTAISAYVRQDSAAAADRMLVRFRALILEVAEMPQIGRIRPELGENVRSLPEGNYVIFYKERRDGIEILRVIHPARNLRRAWRRE